MIISRQIIPGIRNISEGAEKSKTRFAFSNVFFQKSSRFWDNVEKYGTHRPQMTIWRTRNARWVTTATNTQSEYVIFIASPRQQWLRECAAMSHYSTLPVLLWILHTSEGKWHVNTVFVLRKNKTKNWICIHKLMPFTVIEWNNTQSL